MHYGLHVRNRLTLCLGGTALLFLCCWGPSAGAAPPVEELRQALSDPARDPAGREHRLRQCLPALERLEDLRAAVALSEWADTDADEGRAAVDRVVRKLVAERFEHTVQELLRHGDPAVRLAVIDMLADMGVSVRALQGSGGLARDLAPDLADLVAHGPDEVRIAAVRALGFIGPEPNAAMPAVRALLETGNDAQRQAAAAALQHWLELTSQMVMHRVSAANATATRGDWVSVGCALLPLAGPGLADRRPEVRRLCAATIGQAATTLEDLVPDPRPASRTESGFGDGAEKELLPLVVVLKAQVPALTRALADGDTEVRVRARRALQDMAGAQARLLSLGSDAARQGGSPIQTVVFHPDRAATTGTLTEGLHSTLKALAAGVEDRDVTVRRATLDALEALGPAAAPVANSLVKALSDPDSSVRWSAARTLGKISPVGAEQAVPALARLLWDHDFDLRLVAAAALQRYGPTAVGAVPLLTESLRATDAELRVAVLRVLGSIGPGAKSAVTPVAAALGDADERVRQSAALALGQLGTEAAPAVDALRKALDDPDPGVRQAATEALVRIKNG